MHSCESVVLHDPACIVRPKTTSFYVAGLLLLIASGFGFAMALGYAFPALRESVQLVCLVLAGLAMGLGFWFCVWPSAIRMRSAGIHGFSEALHEVDARLMDLEGVRREHYKSRAAIESIHAAFEATEKQITAAADRIAGVLADRAKHEEALSLQRQEMALLKKRVESWRDGMMEFYRLLERTLDGENELQPEYRRAVAKILENFGRVVQPLGLDAICPIRGEEFNDHIHQAEGVEGASDAKPGTVLRCIAWGFREGATVIEPAKVVLAKSLEARV